MLSLCIFLLMTACRDEKQIEKPARPVRVVQVHAIDNTSGKIMLPASINELKEVNLAFRVGGPLIKLNDIVGSYVKEGEVIAQIDPRDFKLAIESAESRYLHAQAEYERYKSLLAKKSASKSLFDQMESNYKLAKTSYESAKNSLVDTEIKAPFSGYINTIFVENFEKVNPGVPIVSLLDLSKYEVNAWISVDDINKINPDTKFVCHVKDGITHKFTGKIKEIGTKSSRSKQSYPISVLVDIPNDIKLRAGMTANLEIINSNEDVGSAYVILITSVFSKNDKSFIWIFSEQTNTVSSRQVKLGNIVSDEMLVITEGLNNSEFVVTAGVHYLQEGQQVKMMNGNSETNVGNQL